MEIGVFEPRQKNNNKDRCAVPGCESKADKNLSLSFHSFPTPNSRFVKKQNIFGNYEKVDAHKAWKIVLKMNDVKKRTKVCSRHFKKSDYFFADVKAQKRILKKNAVPSCNLPGEERKEAINNAKLKRILKRNCATETVNKSDVEQSEQKLQENMDIERWMPDETQNPINKATSLQFPLEKFIKPASPVPLIQYIGVLVNTDCFTPNIMKCTNSESKLSMATGIESFKVLDNIVRKDSHDKFEQNPINKAMSSQFPFEKFIKPASPVPLIKDIGVQVNTDCFMPSIVKCINSDSKLSMTTGIESFKVLDKIVEIVRKNSDDKFEQLNIIMNTKDRIIMTYMKVKQNLSYEFLAVLFNCYSPQHCQRIFHETIKILSKCLKAAISWPSKKEISKNLPKCCEGFEDVRVVLNYTEICVQQSKNLCCQVITNSHNKSNNKCKIMTGVSPAGNITYISKLYGGEMANSIIFQQSSLMQLLEPGDAVIVDRGVLIDEICEKNEWKCIRPTILREKKQFKKGKAILTAKVRPARVYIERSIRRIKSFKMLRSVVPSTLVPLLEDIFTVVCGSINMSPPILSDSKSCDKVNVINIK